MSASIISRTISAIVDKKLVLQNDQAARLISIGSDWSTIRFGMRLAVDAAGLTNNLTGAIHYLGMCSGTANKVGDSTTTNFFGYVMDTSSLAYGGSPPYFNVSGSGIFKVAKKVGSTVTKGSAIVGGVATGYSADATVRDAWIFEIVRGSPNYTINFTYPNSTGAMQTDISYGALVQALEAATITDVVTVLNSYAGGGSYNHTTDNAAFDEGAGVLNAFNIYWILSSRPLEISEVLYVRIA